ncbi:hypothetical protein WG922_02085 [Ramlibacter sp. AN1015]|uniref:hypothetical protein n=1 Tax=Ramlibacter sp. AN1015 TaxID=3133428 RepID=UPI0030C3CDC9
MKKSLAAVAMAALASVAPPSAHSAPLTLTQPFSVQIDFTAGCTMATLASPLVKLNMQAFGEVSSQAAPFSVKCSPSLGHSVVLRNISDQGTSEAAVGVWLSIVDSSFQVPYEIQLAFLGANSKDAEEKLYHIQARGSSDDLHKIACRDGAFSCTNIDSTNNQFEIVVTY